MLMHLCMCECMYVNVYMCVCMRAQVYVCVCLCVCVCVFCPRLTLGAVPLEPSTMFLETGPLSRTQGSLIKMNWSHQPQESSVSNSPT